MGYHGHNSVITVVTLLGVVAVRMLVLQRRRGMGRPGNGGGGRSFTPAPGGSPGRPAGTTASAAAAATGMAPGWFTDPFVKHEQRYWSGTAWTDHVLDGDTPSTDPPPSPRA